MQSDTCTEAFSSINVKLSKLPKIVTKRSIHRVHKELRDVNNDAYEPKLIAIGPYHHGKNDLQNMEERKLHYLQLLLKSRKQDLGSYISAIEELEQEVRDCYAEPISLSRAQFVEMLVLDGCFIIVLVRKSCFHDSTWKDDPIFQTQWINGRLVRDLILFENQIPFFVLCKLFDLIEEQNQHHMLVEDLLRFCWKWGISRELQRPYSGNSEDIKHLLDLVYNHALNPRNGIIERELSVPLEAGSNCIPFKTKLKNMNLMFGKKEVESNFIPFATKLKDANVKFQKKKEWNTWLEINFQKGIMEMPPLNIEDRTECFLRNFIVYEQYFLSDQRNPVTDYVTLLDCLINTSRDVEILSECKVINNGLGSNESVAKIINGLGVSIVSHGEHFVYAKMFKDVNEHYHKVWNRWMAMLRRNIFHSPWGYISFFAALTLLVLTVVQAVCSVLQVGQTP